MLLLYTKRRLLSFVFALSLISFLGLSLNDSIGGYSESSAKFVPWPTTDISAKELFLSGVKTCDYKNTIKAISTGLDLTSEGNDGQTLAHIGIIATHTCRSNKIASKIIKSIDVNKLVNSNKETLLHTAVKMKAHNTARMLLDSGANTNVHDNKGVTPLMISIKFHDKKMIDILFAHGAKTSAHENSMATALIYASKEKYSGIIRKLYEHGSNGVEIDLHRRTPLMYAAWKNDYPSVNTLLRIGSPVNAIEENGNTALFTPLTCKTSLKIVTKLISKAANVNYQNSDGISPLHHFAKCGRLSLVKKVISQGAKLNLQDINGQTPLMLAASQCGYTVTHNNPYYGSIKKGHNCNTNLISYLLRKGARVDMQDNDGNTALIMATKNGEKNSTNKLLLLHGADSDIRNKDGISALMMASQAGETELVKIMLKNGANPNITDNSGMNALSYAISSKRASTISLLISHMSEINAKDKYGNTAAHVAAQLNNIHLLKVLYNANAKMSYQNYSADTPLLIALKYANYKVADLLLEKQNQDGINAEDKSGATAIMYIAENNKHKMLIRAISIGSATDYQDNNGNTALMRAISHNARKTAIELIPLSDIRIKNVLGETALIIAARSGQKQIVKTLLEEGADVNVLNAASETALIESIKSDSTKVSLIILSYGADPRITDVDGNTAILLSLLYNNKPLAHRILSSEWSNQDIGIDMHNHANQSLISVAAGRKDHKMLQKIILRGADINTRDRAGMTPLMIATEAGIEANVRLILSVSNININDTNKEGDTALIIASRNGFENIVKQLISHGADKQIINQAGNSAIQIASRHRNNSIVSAISKARISR